MENLNLIPIVLVSSVFFLFGIYTTFYGFIELKKKRIIENIPKSKIRSMAIGLTEIKGQAHNNYLLRSPFSETPCIYYQCQVEIYGDEPDFLKITHRHPYPQIRVGKEVHWSDIFYCDSSFLPFWISDETGKAFMKPEGADIRLEKSFCLNVENKDEIPKHILRYLHFKYPEFIRWLKRKWLKTVHLRFNEYLIKPKDFLYIIGVCKDNRENIAAKNKEIVSQSLRRKTSLSDDLQKFDINQNGKLSRWEWELCYQIIDSGNLERIEIEEPPLIIGKADNRLQTYFISNKKENVAIELLRKKAIQWLSFGFFMVLVSVVCLVYFIFKN